MIWWMHPIWFYLKLTLELPYWLPVLNDLDNMMHEYIPAIQSTIGIYTTNTTPDHSSDRYHVGCGVCLAGLESKTTCRHISCADYADVPML